MGDDLPESQMLKEAIEHGRLVLKRVRDVSRAGMLEPFRPLGLWSDLRPVVLVSPPPPKLCVDPAFRSLI